MILQVTSRIQGNPDYGVRKMFYLWNPESGILDFEILKSGTVYTLKSRYYLLPVLTETTEIFLPFVWITSARLHVERK